MLKLALVYQAGIANVFLCDYLLPASKVRNARRIVQSDFRTCENFVSGAAYAGATVRTFQCNQAGDVARSVWSEDLDAAPFSDKFKPVNT